MRESGREESVMLNGGGAQFIQLHSADNVCVAIRTLAAGGLLTVGQQPVLLVEEIAPGHKFAIRAIASGEAVLKYGQVIGLASQAIRPGEWVHSHNLAMQDFERDPASATCIPAPPTPITGRTFQGYRRADGQAGTRNYIAVISSVNCSASVAKFIARRFGREELAAYPHVDGVLAFTHFSGCGMQFGGLAHAMLNRVLAGIARHPNVGCLLAGRSGMRAGRMDYLLHNQHLVQIAGAGAAFPRRLSSPCRIRVARTARSRRAWQRCASCYRWSTRPGARRSRPARSCWPPTAAARMATRESPPIRRWASLPICWSPAAATTILAETTEIYGAEHLLTRRAVSVEVAEKLLDRIRWWKWYTGIFGVDMDNNPSVGNKKGGLTTIAEKSLGAVAKAGSTALVDVVQYAEPVRPRGLVVMDTPGYDPVSVTGLVAGGANVVVFTTGRGSCFGCKPTPSIKVATNTPMYERMRDDMDLNAGAILDGVPVQEVGRQIFEEILAVASGKTTKSEQLGVGDEEFVPWIVGPTL